jgi:hypothetical protein
VGKPEGKRLLEDLNVCGWIILKWIVEKYNGVVWTIRLDDLYIKHMLFRSIKSSTKSYIRSRYIS